MKIRIYTIRLFLIAFLLLNIMAAFHGYTLTHFSKTAAPKTQLASLTTLQKVSVLLLGASNPRPVSEVLPQDDFFSINLKGGAGNLAGWYIQTDSAKGEVILFHGYAGEKSSMLERACLIREMGFNTLLIDFRGSGGSAGNQTTIGYKEAEDVKTAVAYLTQQGRKNIYLLGTSMGAASIMHALAIQQLPVEGIILECPFGSMMQTAQNRFEGMGVPSFPGAQLLVFWGSIQNGFWGFSHNPGDYAKAITVPTLLVYGEKDKRVKPCEIDQIFSNLAGEKVLLSMPLAGHGDYLKVDEVTWKEEVNKILKKLR